MKHLLRFIIFLLPLLSCSTNEGINDTPSPLIFNARIFYPGGTEPAPGAVAKIYNLNDTTVRPATILQTDEHGLLSITGLSDGIYSIRIAKDTLILLQDSVFITAGYTTLRDDTLEHPVTVSGVVDVAPLHDPRMVIIRATGKPEEFRPSDVEGHFTITGLSSGRLTLTFSNGVDGYLPATAMVVVTEGISDTLRDTVKLVHTGIPAITGLRIAEDTAIGIITVTWNKPAYGAVQDFVIYRDIGSGINLSMQPLFAVSDTIFIDTSFRGAIPRIDDTASIRIKYRVALRDPLQRIGPSAGYSEMVFVPKGVVATFFSHSVTSADLPIDSASINDTLLIRLSAWSKTRRMRSLIWFDPGKNDTVTLKTFADSTAKNIADTVSHAFDSVGTRRLIAIANDESGIEWRDTVLVTIVNDPPVADAGNDTGVFAGGIVHLHGGAFQQFGTIKSWQWKIGQGNWSTTSGSDTTIPVPAITGPLPCSLAVVDDDGNRDVDGMVVLTSQPAVHIAANYFTSLVLLADSSLWGFGGNFYGQIGFDSTASTYMADAFLPKLVLPGVIKMSAGYAHTLMITSDNALWACGSNNSGELGDGSTMARLYPVKIMGDVADAAAGTFHSLILKTDNTLWACGLNDVGQLGDGSAVSRRTPVKIMDDVKSMAAGYGFSLIIKNDNTLWICGNNPGSTYMADTIEYWLSPYNLMSNASRVSAGYQHALILASDGTLWGFGQNFSNQLGDGSFESKVRPTELLTEVSAMASGQYFNIALKTDGTLWGCGENGMYQMSFAGSNPSWTRIFESVDGVREIAAGESHTLLLKTDGSVWACGGNISGQLGNGTMFDATEPQLAIPVQRSDVEIDFGYYGYYGY